MVESIEAAVAADPHQVADETLRRLMPRVQRARNLLDAADVRLVGVFHAKKLGEADALSTIQWLAHKTRVPTADARDRINAAASLRHLPETEAAFAAGRIGKAQVLALARVDSDRTAEKLEKGEHYLIDHAADDDFATFERILRAWKLSADPDGPEPRCPRRRFDLRRGPDGEWDGRLLAPADEGAAIDAALAPFERIEWERDWAEARRIHGVDAAAHHLPRTASERRLAALLALVSRGAGSPDGTREPKPLVNIVVTQAAFERALAQAAGLAVERLDPTKAHEFDCRLIDGTPIDAATMLEPCVVGVRATGGDPVARGSSRTSDGGSGCSPDRCVMRSCRWSRIAGSRAAPFPPATVRWITGTDGATAAPPPLTTGRRCAIGTRSSRNAGSAISSSPTAPGVGSVPDGSRLD